MYFTLAFLLFATVLVQDTVAIRYVSIGCFNDKTRPLPQLIKNLRGQIDWSNFNKTIEACAKEAKKKGYLYFGVQFWGECWSGPLAHLTYYRDGSSKHCILGVGKSHANAVYMLTGKENECSDYNILNSADRSQTHITSGHPKCDHWTFGFGQNSWYRFNSSAGQTIADKCVDPMRCQTFRSGWMDGQHPEVVDGIQSRRVCFSFSNNCCSREAQISVRNCGKFYVYKLPTTAGCHARYCGNGTTVSSVV